jgi:hypothetical protein
MPVRAALLATLGTLSVLSPAVAAAEPLVSVDTTRLGRIDVPREETVA